MNEKWLSLCIRKEGLISFSWRSEVRENTKRLELIDWIVKIQVSSWQNTSLYHVQCGA
jgi:hypothetical protein